MSLCSAETRSWPEGISFSHARYASVLFFFFQAEDGIRDVAVTGVQTCGLPIFNAQVQLLTAQSTRLQALFGYNSSLAEFDRATGAQSTFHEMFANLTPRATQTKTYYTGSGVDAEGHPKHADDSAVRTSTGRSRTSYSK